MSNNQPVEVVDDEFDDDIVIVDEDDEFETVEDIDADDTYALATISGEHVQVVQTDPATGEDVEFSIDMSMPPLGVAEAKDLTEKIRTSVNVIYVLLKRAHAGKAWAALGYTTFEEYVREEFNISRSYAYKLLNQANVIEAIESVAPEGTQIYIGEGVARNIKKVLPEVLQELEERLDNVEAPDEAGAIIEDVLRERQKRKSAPAGDGDGEDEEPRQYDKPYNGDYDNYDDDDEEEEAASDTGGADDPADMRRKFEKLYALYSSLKNIADLGDGGELIDFIPENRHEEFSSLLTIAIPWLTEFDQNWRKYLAEQPEASDEDDDEFLDDYDEDDEDA